MTNQKEDEFLTKLMATFRVEAEEHVQALSKGVLALEAAIGKEEQRELLENTYREAHSLKGAARAVNQGRIQEICQSLENVFSAWPLEPTTELFSQLHDTIDALTSAIGQLEGEQPQESLHSLPPRIDHLCKSDKSIRVSVTKLDTLFQRAEEMLTAKFVVKQQLLDLRNVLKELQSEATRESVTKLVRTSEQNVYLVTSLVDGLLEDLKKVLMQPTSTLFAAMPRMVRDIAHQLGKEVHLNLQGGDIEVDRRILDEIKDPIIHLIRNSIDHGIENPAVRSKTGKATFGTIHLSATQTSGGNVEIAVSDDGKGFDIEKLKKAAIDQDPLAKMQMNAMSDSEALKLAFRSGVSTSSEVTDLSGRGLGLSIVSQKVDQLGGHLVVDSIPHKGTNIRLQLPLTLATFRGIQISVAGQEFIIPTQYVTRVLRVTQSDIQPCGNTETVVIDNRPIPYHHLAKLLKLTQNPREAETSTFILILKSAEKSIAFGADNIHDEREVLVKGLGTQIKNMMAATIAEGGEVLPILNPAELIESAAQNTLGGTC